MPKKISTTVFGYPNVGKTSIINRLVPNGLKFKPKEDFTETPQKYKIIHNKKELTFEIFETEDGHEWLSHLSPIYPRSSIVALVVFSVIDRNSFNKCERLVQFVQEKYLLTKIIIIVGNKSDLNIERDVTEDEAHHMAMTWNCFYIETSCKSDQKLTDLLSVIVEAVDE